MNAQRTALGWGRTVKGVLRSARYANTQAGLAPSTPATVTDGLSAIPSEASKSQNVQSPQEERESAPLLRIHKQQLGRDWSKTPSSQDKIHRFLRSLGPSKLRDMCTCPRCIDPSTKQREYSFVDIPSDIVASTITSEKGHWKVTWKNDIAGFTDHVSTYSPAQLDEPSSPLQEKHLPAAALWNRELYEAERHTCNYDDFLHDDSSLAGVLFFFHRHGLVFLQNIPNDTDAVKRIALRLGVLRNTFYGETWDVKSVPQAKNVAYTSKHLGFHMDLLYMKEPPGVQLLHCLQNTCQGGESRFVDSLKAADVFFEQDPLGSMVLEQMKIRYTYDNDGYFYTNTHNVFDMCKEHVRVIQNNTSQRARDIANVFWSPPFVGSIDAAAQRPMPTSLEASRAFASILERNDMVYEAKMNPGECAIFDNLRVMHARNAFDLNSGNRWLRGAYLNTQELTSHGIRLKHLMKDHEETFQSK